MTKIKLNNLEISQEDLIKEVQNNPEMMKMLQEKFKKKEGWFVPEVGEEYYALNIFGDVLREESDNTIADKERLSFQKVYRTKEEAKQASLRQQAKIRILKTIAEENAKVGWVYDLGDDKQVKSRLEYDDSIKKVSLCQNAFIQAIESDFYFSPQIKDIILEKCAEDYKIYLGIK